MKLEINNYIKKDYFLNIGIIAHNEERNISILLDKFIEQLKNIRLSYNITVVASGCTDRTEDIVRYYENKDNSHIKLLIENQRKGKACAINHFLNNPWGDFIVISSADIFPSNNALKEFINSFSDPLVGMAGGRPIPRYSAGIVGLLNSILWELHHEIALRKPKLGELIVFRNIIDKIPEETAADEAAIEALITQKGFKLKYLPGVTIYNYCPQNFTSFIKKRVRIFIGHLYVKDRMNYKVSTYNITTLISTIIKKITKEKRRAVFIILLVCLEIYARAIALYEYRVRNKLYAIWER